VVVNPPKETIIIPAIPQDVLLVPGVNVTIVVAPVIGQIGKI
jgi:hypothetical protein